MKRLLVLAFLALSAVGVLAAEQRCQNAAPGGQQVAPQTEQNPAQNPDQCPKKKKDDVSWVDWAIGSHQMPSLHFVDFLELFVR